MTLPAVSIMVRSTDDVTAVLRRAAGAARAGARLVEWRVDAMAAEAGADSPGTVAAARRLLRDSPLPSIATCRRSEEGGAYDGPEAARAELLAALISSDRPPRYLDVELSAWEDPAVRAPIEAALRAASGRPGAATSLILSVHDQVGRPADLLQKVERLAAQEHGAVIKLAWQARTLRDNLEAFDLLLARFKPAIALCMGRFGLMSRVLAPKFGALLTYAADRPGAETAPGQPTLAELRDLYRFDRIGPQARVYGVVGWPAEHSLSPAVHNAGFEAVGHPGVYLPLPVPPEYEHFKATVGALVDHPRLDFRGASVTIPHKENLIRFVRGRGGAVEADAELIGSANTLVVADDGSLACSNTDAPAALASLCAGMEIGEDELVGRRVAILGAGGVARAVVAGLSLAGATVVLFNRSAERAEALARDFHGRPTASGEAARVVVGKPDAIGCGCFDVIVNCTPLGMAGGPAPGRSPLPEEVVLGPEVVVFDTVYAPPRTPLLEQAEARGAKAIGGLDMFLRQAAMQFLRWTGREAPLDVFEGALRERATNRP